VEAAPGALPERDFASSLLVAEHEFVAPMKVRAFEIDQYAVVNNAVYVQYLQHGAPLYSSRMHALQPQQEEHHHGRRHLA
jgi:acyl-CoA thioesterase FadM